MEKNITNQAMFTAYPDVVDVAGLSEMLGISTKTGYGLLQDNKIRHFRIGRDYKIPKIYVIEYLKNESMVTKNS